MVHKSSGLASGGGSGGGVASFNSRTGVVNPQWNDYQFNLIGGTAGVSQGGTGQTTFPNHSVLLGEGNITPVGSATTGSPGRIFIDQGAGDPAFKTVTGDWTINQTGVSVVSSVNGVSYGASPSTNTVPVVTGANTVTYEAVPIAAGGTGQTTNTAAFDALAPSSPAQGDIFYYNGTHWVLLAPGTSGQFLKTQGASANPVWATGGGGGGSPGGNQYDVQTNDGSGGFHGDDNFWYNPANGTAGQTRLGGTSGSGVPNAPTLVIGYAPHTGYALETFNTANGTTPIGITDDFNGNGLIYWNNASGYQYGLQAPSGGTSSTTWNLPPQDNAGIMVSDGAGNLRLTTVAIDSNNNISGYGPKITQQSGTTYTLAQSDTGTIVEFTSGSAVTVTLPSTLHDFYCEFTQIGGGQVTFTAGGGATLNSYTSLVNTAGQYARASVYTTSTGVYQLGGQLA